MTAVDLTREVKYKNFPLNGKETIFHCSVAFTTKAEAHKSAKEIRDYFDQPARVVKSGSLYYVYMHGES